MVRKSALALLVFTSLSGTAWAGDKPLYEAAPSWVTPAPEPDFAKLTDSDPMIVLLDQQVRVQGDRAWNYADRAVRAISAQMLSEIGQVKIPWQPDDGDLIVHRAEIIRGGQRIDLVAQGQRFQVLQREEQLEEHSLTGMLTATMSVEGLRVGDVLRIAYSVTARDKALLGNVQTLLPLLVHPARAGFARARVEWPSAEKVNWRTYAELTAPKVATRDGFDRIEILQPLGEQPELPDDAPMRYQRPPILEVSSFADWASVSKVMAPLYATTGLIAPGSPLAKEVERIAAKTQDPRTRAALALQLVQDEVRYLFKGMDGGNYVPQAPAQTWELRYGDCKAKTLLLLALLHALDVEAEAVAANIGTGDLVPKRLPSAGAFNHVLVRATVGGETLWLDGTGSNTRLPDLADVPPLQHVLPLRASGAELMALAARAPARATVEIDLEVDQSAGLSLPAVFALSFQMRGPMAQMMQAMSSQANKEQLIGLAQQMATPVIGEADLTPATISYDPEAATAVVRTTGIFTTPWTLSEGRYRMVLDKTIDGMSFAPDRTRVAWKDMPVRTGGPFTTAYRLRMRLPAKGAGFTVEGDETLPAELAGAGLSRSVRLDDGWIRVADRQEDAAREVAAADVPRARAQIAAAKARLLTAVAPDDYPARWKMVAEARRDGSLKPILAAYARSIADDPEEARPYLNRANFLYGIWDWKGALADMDRAIEIEPSADAYANRARVRRALRDDAGAARDAEAALDLEPDHEWALGQLAELTAQAGKLDVGLALITSRAETTSGKDRERFTSTQAQLLADHGRASEAVALLDPLLAKSPGNATLLNSRCWIKGIGNIALDTALKDCTKSIELAEQPANALDSRALVYFRMGRLDEALADLDAALAIAPGQTASLFLRGVVRKRVGDKRADEDLAAVRTMWPRVDEEYARYGIKP